MVLAADAGRDLGRLLPVDQDRPARSLAGDGRVRSGGVRRSRDPSGGDDPGRPGGDQAPARLVVPRRCGAGGGPVSVDLGGRGGGFLVKHRLAGLQPVGMSGLVMVSSALLLAPPALATPPDETPGLGPVAAVAALGILGTGVAFVIFYWLIARVGPAR